MQTDTDKNLLAIKKLLMIQRHLQYKDRFDYTALNSIAKTKNHYDLVRSFFTTETIASKNLYSFSNIKETDQIIPGLKSLTDFIFSKKNKNFLVDFFTFSILPSYFKFFWTSQSITQLSDFFFLIRNDPSFKDEQFDLLARVVFLSPNFLFFSELAFQPIFILFYDCSKKNFINKENILKLSDPQQNIRLFESISKFKYLFPAEAFVVLKLSTNTMRTLKNSFIMLALSSKKNSYLYKLFHFSQEPSEKLLSKLQSNLDQFLQFFIENMIENNQFLAELSDQLSTMMQNFDISNQQKLTELTSKVNDTNIYQFHSNSEINNHIQIESMSSEEIEMDRYRFATPKYIFSPIEHYKIDDLKYYQEYFNPLFISSNDLNLFNFFNQKSTSFQPTNEITLFLDFNGTLSNYQRIKITMNNDLKTFLLKSKQISLYQLQVTSLYNFFTTLNGTHNPLPNFHEVIQNLCNISMNGLMTEINNSFLSLESEPIKHNFAIDHIFPILNYNDMIAERQTLYMYRVLDYFYLLSKKFKVSPLKKCINQPSIFENDYRKILYSNQKIDESAIYQRMFKEMSFTMHTYFKERENIKQNLIIYNQQMKIFFSNKNNYIGYFQEEGVNRAVIEFVDTFPNNFYNNPIVLENDPQIEIIGKIVIDAFLDDSMLRKCHLLSLMFLMICSEFRQKTGKSLMSADDATLVLSLILLKVNPPNLMSNIIFMGDSLKIKILPSFFSTALFCIFGAFDEENPNIIERSTLFSKYNG